ncbi:MAG: hypothetical protein LH467_07750, partial [Gemmatimonadaceae bacterium]|nr:hypothetical protein [Gemmatimonadaceae bacterium]
VWGTHFALYVFICIGTVAANLLALYVEIVPLWLMTAATCAALFRSRRRLCYQILGMTILLSLAIWGAIKDRGQFNVMLFAVAYFGAFVETFIVLRALGRAERDSTPEHSS